VKPVSLLDLSGRYVNGEVSLSWRYPPGAPDTIYIYPIYGISSERKVSISGMTQQLLRDAPFGYKFVHQVSNPRDVTRCEFLVFLGTGGETPKMLENMIDNPDYTVTVIVGSATVFYSIKTKKIENDFEKHIISLKSDYSMEPGILGYTFTSVGQQFTAAFPGTIERGKYKFPPFFTYVGAHVSVRVVGGTNADVYAVAKNKV
jgi:hypothetical protein